MTLFIVALVCVLFGYLGWRFIRAARPDIMGLDRCLAALGFRAKRGETLSLMAALSQQRGERWGCRMCKLLDIIVQRGHCAWTLTSTGELTGMAAFRAGLALLVVVLIPLTIWTLLIWRTARWY